MERLVGANAGRGWQQKYRSLFREAYPSKNEFTIVDVANAIAHFEEMAFPTRDSAWDRFLLGTTAALPADAKLGALVFYGKGRCAVCHSGPLFSDFNYHSIGIFESASKAAEDFGRWNATGREEDRYKFRTPPLRNVTKTAPYFHNGSEPSLRRVIQRHFEPLAQAGKYNADGSFAISARQINAVSPVLVTKLEVSEQEVNYLLVFLGALDYQLADPDILIPKTVPSGLPIAYR